MRISTNPTWRTPSSCIIKTIVKPNSCKKVYITNTNYRRTRAKRWRAANSLSFLTRYNHLVTIFSSTTSFSSSNGFISRRTCAIIVSRLLVCSWKGPSIGRPFSSTSCPLTRLFTFSSVRCFRNWARLAFERNATTGGAPSAPLNAYNKWTTS